MKKHKEDFILLAEAGFIAVNHADEEGAMKLFKAAELIDPKNVLPRIGIGYLHLHKLELKQAIKNFEDVLELEPQNEMAKAFMGLCMTLMPNQTEKGEKMLTQSAKSKDPLIKKLATSTIDFIDKFIKKPPGPAGKGR